MLQGIFNKKTARKSFPSTAMATAEQLTNVYECHICNVGFTYASPYKGHLVQHYRWGFISLPLSNVAYAYVRSAASLS